MRLYLLDPIVRDDLNAIRSQDEFRIVVLASVRQSQHAFQGKGYMSKHMHIQQSVKLCDINAFITSNYVTINVHI